jgi:two-component system sensor histidine kinase/response regulator
LAEDNDINRQVASELLESAGASVRIATNGAEAVAAASAEDFDIVLMDVHMPVMDGMHASRVIREIDSPRAKVPVVALTANAMVEDRARCVASGMNDHLAKPIEQNALYATVLRWTRPGGAVAASARPGAGSADQCISSSLPAEEIRTAEVDVGSALLRLGGKQDLYARVARRFVEDADIAATLTGQLDRNDREEAMRTAHSIKGVAGMLGADALQRIAADLEGALRDGTDCAGLLAEFCTAYAQARDILAERFATEAPGSPPARGGDVSLASRAARLDSALAADSDEALQHFADIMDALEPHERPAFAEVGRLIADYDMPAARTALQAVVRRWLAARSAMAPEG